MASGSFACEHPHSYTLISVVCATKTYRRARCGNTARYPFVLYNHWIVTHFHDLPHTFFSPIFCSDTRLSDLDGDLSLIENGEDVLDVPLHVESEHNLESYVPPTPDSSVAHIPAIPHKWFSPSQYLKFVTVFAGISGLLFGYDLGVITGALLMMKVAFNLSDGQEELVVSLVVAGSVIGYVYLVLGSSNATSLLHNWRKLTFLFFEFDWRWYFERRMGPVA
jgi:hypothetical protein